MKTIISAIIFTIFIPATVFADDLTLEETQIIERQKIINEAEYYTTEIDAIKELLFDCTTDKLGKNRGLELKAKMTSQKLVTKLNNILKTARLNYCEYGNITQANAFVKKSSEYTYRDMLGGRESVILKQCAKRLSLETYNEAPCIY